MVRDKFPLNYDPKRRLQEIRNSLANAALKSGRSPESVTLIGVSKFKPAEAVVEYACAGLFSFGENRVQEASGKIPAVGDALAMRNFDTNQLRWSLIGHLQSNKVRRAAEIFDEIQTIDSVELALKLASAAQSLERTIDCFVQVNTSGEASKSGSTDSESLRIAEALTSAKYLTLKGLMTIGPLTGGVSATRRSFENLCELRDKMQMSYPESKPLGLSMGMSGDYELAIACGATVVRIGTALFGERIVIQEAG